MIRYLDVCSGYSAFSLAAAGLGFRCVGYSEIEAFPRAVLEQRHAAVPVEWDYRFVPGGNTVPLFGDFTKIESHHVGPVDLLAGGTPCQAFSVAGKRLGLDDPRGNLTLEFLALARRVRARWLVWENVPGFLSHDSGRTMGTFLRLLGELGYGWAYRVLDAQYIRVDGHEGAVPQRRRRLFVVAHLGDEAGPAAVLFERESLRGDPAPRREAEQGVARPLGAGSASNSGYRNDADTAENLIPLAFGGNDTRGPIDIATARSAHGGPHGRLDFDTETFIAQPIPFDTTQITSVANGSQPRPGHPCHPLARGAHAPTIAYRITPNDGAYETGDISGSLTTGTDRSAQALVQPIAFQERGREGGRNVEWQEGLAYSLNAPSGGGRRQELNIADQWAVRRLTPTECERLMGVPHGFTAITYRGKPAADGPRYKALGNSQAVNVMRWIARGLGDVIAIQRDTASSTTSSTSAGDPRDDKNDIGLPPSDERTLRSGRLATGGSDEALPPSDTGSEARAA